MNWRKLPAAMCCLVVPYLVAGISGGVVADEPTPDGRAIQTAIQSYTEAFNRHDAQALADHWTANGEFVMPSGVTLIGRDKIAKEFQAYFAEAPEVRMELAEPSIDFLSPNVAMESGSATVLQPNQDPATTEYVAIHTRTSSGWKMDSVRETDAAEPTSIGKELQQLEWMVGSWVDTSEEEGVTVETTCRWTKNHSFLTRSYKVFVEGRADAEGTQVIAWDPRNETIRSWLFDVDGGFGVGAWSQDGDTWNIRTLTVLPDGRQGSFTVILEKVDDNSFQLSTIGREIDGEVMPNIEPVTVVRK
ncbi:MAG TPA: nuclear transport factor 2 family protein [Pirellulaceae bacterium]